MIKIIRRILLGLMTILFGFLFFSIYFLQVATIFLCGILILLRLFIPFEKRKAFTEKIVKKYHHLKKRRQLAIKKRKLF